MYVHQTITTHQNEQCQNYHNNHHHHDHHHHDHHHYDHYHVITITMITITMITIIMITIIMITIIMITIMIITTNMIPSLPQVAPPDNHTQRYTCTLSVTHLPIIPSCDNNMAVRRIAHAVHVIVMPLLPQNICLASPLPHKQLTM